MTTASVLDSSPSKPEAGCRKHLRLAVVMTCFNRREKTLACLGRLFTQERMDGLALAVYVLDDRSSDGTPEAIKERWPAVHLLQGDGQLFWNRGMHRAFAAALRDRHDAYIWLNDDTMLLPDALRRLVDTWTGLRAHGANGILAGSTYDALSGGWSYGGFSWRSGWRRELVPTEPAWDKAVPCATMNGNFTLIPDAVTEKLGNLEPAFQHSFGDFDYGLRARAAGIGVSVAPGFYGSCSDNNRAGTWRDLDLTLRQRLQQLRSPKGSPWAQWSLYCRRHLGFWWPLYAVSPYLRTVLTSVPWHRRAERA